MAEWQTLSSRVVYDNPWMTVHEDQVTTPAGEPGIYGYVEAKQPSVYIVPIDEDSHTWIVEQYRYPLKKNSWECVAGHVEDGEETVAAASRELREEAGLEAGNVHVLHTIQAGSGMAQFPRTICIARSVNHVSDELDVEDGILGVRRLPLSEVVDMILAGEMTDATSIAAFLMVQAYIIGEA